MASLDPSDILGLPGMSGETGAIVKPAVTLLFDAARCVGMLDLFACFSAIIDLAELAWALYTALFPTRAKVGKDSASDDTALFFIPAANPVIKLWGIGIRDLESLGIPTSTSGGPGYTAQLNLATAVLHDLQKQFDGPGAPKLSLQGVPASGQQVFAWYHLLGFQTNHPDSNATAIAERVKVDNLYLQLIQRGWIDPKTGFPFKGQPPPPNPCPAGQHWDATLGKCVPDAPPQPQKCPAGYHWDATLGKCVQNLPPVPPEQPEQDELQDCCDETQAALANLYGAISQLSVGGGGDAACCANIVAAIMALTAQVTAVAASIGGGPSGGTTIDLTPIVTELAQLVAAVSVAGRVDLKEIVAELTRIADGLSPAAVTPAKRPPYSPFVQKLIAQAEALRKDAADELALVRPDLAQTLTS